jgi:peptidyl-prolyl cis-trans isomerase C
MATVNGTAITRAEVNRATQIIIAQNHIPQNQVAGIRKQLETAALDQLISAEVAFQAGMKLEIKDLDKQVSEKADMAKSKFPSPAEYEAALKTNNITDKEIRELIRKDVVISNLFEKQVVGKITVTDEETRKFYDENQDKFKQSESFHASHILIGVKPDATPDEKQKAREKAESLKKRLLAGEDFSALAKSESTCPSSSKGGDLGFFGKGEMVPAFENATAALKPGEVSNVVETQFGFHIIKLIEKKDGGVVKLADAKESIQDYLKQQKTQKAVGEYVATLKTSAKIERMDK